MYLQKMQTSVTPTHLQLINTNVFYQINPDLGSTYWTKSGTKILVGWVYIFLNIQLLNPVFEEGKKPINLPKHDDIRIKDMKDFILISS